jgi:AcrR family transcriptional regulator
MASPGHRERLLKGARECLRTKGYAATTARDIVAASDTNLASIGYHFGSKEKLLQEAIMEGFAEWTEFLGRSVFAAADAPPDQRLRTAWRVMLESFEPNKDLLTAWIDSLAASLRSPELHEQLAEHIRDSRTAVRAMVEAALGPTDADTHAIASFLIAACDGLVIQWLIEPGALPTGDELMDALASAGERLIAMATDAEPA